MNASEVIKEAAAVGIRIAIEGDGLLLEATTAPPKAMIALITQHDGNHHVEPANLRLSRGRHGQT